MHKLCEHVTRTFGAVFHLLFLSCDCEHVTRTFGAVSQCCEHVNRTFGAILVPRCDCVEASMPIFHIVRLIHC